MELINILSKQSVLSLKTKEELIKTMKTILVLFYMCFKAPETYEIFEMVHSQIKFEEMSEEDLYNLNMLFEKEQYLYILFQILYNFFIEKNKNEICNFYNNYIELISFLLTSDENIPIQTGYPILSN